MATRLGIGVYDEAWFEHRLTLFEAITVPSMRAQTNQDFTWLLAIDEQMPSAPFERLHRIVADVPNAEFLRVEFKSGLKDAVATWAKERAVEAGAEHALTSRLDDDDALHVDCVARLREEAERFFITASTQYAAFAFTQGSMWIPMERRGYTRFHPSHSLGLSVLEPVTDCRGIYAWPHQDLLTRLAPRGAYLRAIDGDELWWLYTTHVLADSDTGDLKRLAKVRDHRYGYDVDDAMLARYGLDPAVIDGLADLPQPTVGKPVKRLAVRAIDTEREITQLRQRLASAASSEAAPLRAKLAELEAARREAGSGLVATAPAATGPVVPAARQGWLTRLGMNRSKR
ncbi:glycosyltransferase [Stackebrandtia soli]|uniref:glycosyltransferase n=1 Tax=Stackebrandtia soli TaxID=1892856 RepID=UPI0039EB81CF